MSWNALGVAFEGCGFVAFLTTVVFAVVLFPDYLPRNRVKSQEIPIGLQGFITARDQLLVRFLVRTWKWGLYGGGLLMIAGYVLKSL
jgi:hypothetical protein